MDSYSYAGKMCNVLCMYCIVNVLWGSQQHCDRLVRHCVMLWVLRTNLVDVDCFTERMQWESTDLQNPATVDMTLGTCQMTMRLEHRFVQIRHSLQWTTEQQCTCHYFNVGARVFYCWYNYSLTLTDSLLSLQMYFLKIHKFLSLQSRVFSGKERELP